jgi:hypothetical protein
MSPRGEIAKPPCVEYSGPRGFCQDADSDSTRDVEATTWNQSAQLHGAMSPIQKSPTDSSHQKSRDTRTTGELQPNLSVNSRSGPNSLSRMNLISNDPELSSQRELSMASVAVHFRCRFRASENLTSLTVSAGLQMRPAIVCVETQDRNIAATATETRDDVIFRDDMQRPRKKRDAILGHVASWGDRKNPHGPDTADRAASVNRIFGLLTSGLFRYVIYFWGLPR